MLPEPLRAADFHPFDAQKARIGQLLFYDPILSGNRNIACATCHHHDHGGTDGLSLGIGEGGRGIGPARDAGVGADRIDRRIPRNAPALWNLGHRSVEVLFHDGRLSISDRFGNGYRSPAGNSLPRGLETLLAAQALFPMVAPAEMAGAPGENDIADAVRVRVDTAWPLIAARVREIPEYGRLFVTAFDHVARPGDVTIVEIANALAAFIGTEWTNHDSPFDAYLTSGTPLPEAAARGMALFFGPAGCSGCHSGPLLSDQQFHALGLPAFGPGRTRRWDPMPRDVGRMGETDRLEDAYRFRTPALRNVALTAPYGHNGAYPDLRSMIRHVANPAAARAGWVPDMAALPPAPWLAEQDFVIREDRREMARQAAALDITPQHLTEGEIDALEAFLHALTGETALARPLGRPDHVPSGLPVE